MKFEILFFVLRFQSLVQLKVNIFGYKIGTFPPLGLTHHWTAEGCAHVGRRLVAMPGTQPAPTGNHEIFLMTSLMHIIHLKLQ
jgi:hypothetical protein